MKEFILFVSLLIISLFAVKIYLLTPDTTINEPLIGTSINSSNVEGPSENVSGLADFNIGLPLSDFLDTKTGLTDFDSAGCVSIDTSRQTELGGQYVQRTNNYHRYNPDTCSQLLTEFVGSVYTLPGGQIGTSIRSVS